VSPEEPLLVGPDQHVPGVHDEERIGHASALRPGRSLVLAAARLYLIR